MFFQGYLVPLFFLIAIIYYLGRTYWEKRDPKIMIQLTSLILALCLITVQFILLLIEVAGRGDRFSVYLTIVSKTFLPQGIAIGLLMGFIINCLRPFPLFFRIVCTVIMGPVLFTLFGGFLYQPRPTETTVLLGLLMGALLGVLQMILFAFTTTKDKLKFDNELPVW
jgi:hypothetical protein